MYDKSVSDPEFGAIEQKRLDTIVLRREIVLRHAIV
jgi:hypothetical protein